MSVTLHVAASTLLARYTNRKPDPFSQEYESSSWALINLLDYYEFRGDSAKVSRVKEIARAAFLSGRPECNPNIERPGFMAICTNWAWLVSKIVTREEFISWVSKFLAPSELPKPIVDPKSAHEYGLNFSRSWGLWHIFSVVQIPNYLDSYIDHVNATLDNKSNWDGDYEIVGHWVPQFGMFAVQPLLESKFK